MPSPEFPILAAGGVSIAAGVAKAGGWPATGTGALVGTLVMAFVASATSRTKVAPVVTALAWLVFVAVLIRAVPVFSAASAAPTKNAKVKP